MSKKIVRQCGACGNDFEFAPCPSRSGRGKWCSRACYHSPAGLAERFWGRVDRAGPVLVATLGPCWVWTGHRNNQGYGRISVGRRADGWALAHRVAWELARGPITAPCVLHRCDGGAIGCVRPDHLFLGTQADNVADMCAKRRHWSQVG